MILEKIIEYPRIILTDKMTIATYMLAGASAGLMLFDGKIDPMNVVSLLIAGIATMSATAAPAISYKDVEEICENSGFTENIMRNKGTKKMAEIYAKCNRRIDEFDIASKKYSI